MIKETKNMRKIILPILVLTLVLVGSGVGATTLNSLDPWKGWLSRVGHRSNVPDQWKKVEIFEDRNGCQYLVATGGSAYDYAAYGISITPRINSATHQPHCE